MINVYDFDKTIYDGDSSIDFYLFCLKKNKRILLLLFIQIYGFIMYKIGLKDKEFFKGKFFCFLKYFKNIDKLVDEFWKVKEKNIKKWYLDKKKKSDVIISASPEFLLKPICKKLGVKLIASDVNKNTGEFLSKNCHDSEKVERFKKECNKEIDNFYSDSYSDEDMAKIAKHAFIVKKNDISKWDFNKNKENKTFKLVIWFTIFFCILFYFCIEYYFSKYGKSYFRTYDGLDQHYIIFVYIGDLIRSLLHGKLVLWNNGIGYGADVLTTLAAYLHDPFNYISVFFSHEKSELGFNLMIFFKFYAVGLSFILYGLYKKYDYKTILAGSILYTFCATTYVAFSESFFINPMYIFPILLIGANKLLRENKPVLYVLSLSYAIINYFYFGYMMCIFIFFFCLINYLFDKEIKKSTKNFFNIILRFLLYSILAFGISCVVLLPIMKVLLSIDRLDISYYLPKFYTSDYYLGLFKGFTNFYYMSMRDAYVGFGSLSLASILVLFFVKGKNTLKYKIEFILLFIILLIPYLSTILNGFSYYANRWVWALAFLVCDIVCLTKEQFKNMKSGHLVLFGIILTVFSFIIEVVYNYTSVEFITSLVLSFIILFITYYIRDKKIFNYLYILFAILSVVVPAHYYFDEKYFNSTHEEVERDSAYKKIYSYEYDLLKDLENDGLRYDTSYGGLPNISWLYGRSGFNHYISIYNNDINVFNDDIGLVTLPNPMSYNRLNNKSELDHLFGVKYYISNTHTIPYGYQESQKDEIYNPKKEVSLIYGFNKVINKNDYDKLTTYEKEKVLLDGIVLEDEKTNFDIKKHAEEVNYKLICGNNIKCDDNTFIVDRLDSIKLVFDEIVDSETYILLSGIDYSFEDDEDTSIRAVAYYKNSAYLSRGLTINNYRTHMFGNKKNYLINLRNDRIDRIDIDFNRGKFVINEIKIYKRKLSDIDESINRLNNIVTSSKYENNRFDFEINSNKNEYALITIPYAYGGWRAYLDNEKVEIVKADTAFMAIKVPKGKHKLVLKYRTPMLIEGLTISIISIIILLIIIKRKRKVYEKI